MRAASMPQDLTAAVESTWAPLELEEGTGESPSAINADESSQLLMPSPTYALPVPMH